MSHDKTCFVISPIDDPDSDTRKRADQVLKHVIRPAVSTCGYQAVRADEIDKPGIITSQVIQHVVVDPLVVADLTERNPNVFYELAIRHALRKPLVQIIRKGETIPFDVAGTRTIYVDHKDLDSVETAKNEIVEQVRALEKDSSALETPISVSLDLQILRQSEKPEERSLADLVASVSELRTSLNKVESRIGTKDQQGMLDEIQNELRALPGRLEEYSAEFPQMAWMRRGRVHPRMLFELVHMLPGQQEGLGILVVASIFRDAMPWVYELGLETYRIARRGPAVEAAAAIREFRLTVELSLHGPWSRDFFGRGKETFVMMEELEPLLERLLMPSERDEKAHRKKTP